MSPPVLAGQKRSIDQVDSAQNRSSSTKSSFSQIRREDEFYIYEENNTQSSTDADKQVCVVVCKMNNKSHCLCERKERNKNIN